VDFLAAVRDARARERSANRWLVRGGPGTGKSALLAASVAGLVGGGVPGGSITVVASSARAVESMQRSISGAMHANAVEGRVAAGTEPQVRTVHSLAYAVVAMAAARRGVPAPRLLTGAEHDAIFRQALLGVVEDGGMEWPESVRPALSTRGFARELRDVVLRLSERGVDPSELERLGRERGNELWVAAAEFARRHEQEMVLRDAASASGEDPFPASLNAAELVSRAVEELDADPELLAGPGAIEALVVDDAQLVDPMAGTLLVALANRGRVLIAAHSADEAVFRFRGASDAFVETLKGAGANVVELARIHRSTEASEAARVLARRLPGVEAWRRPGPSESAGEHGAPERSASAGDGADTGDGTGAESGAIPPVAFRTERSLPEEASVVADYLLRMHHVHGIPWENMAVVFRSVGDSAELFQRTCDSVGIPVVDAGAEVPPALDPMVRALLDLVESVLDTPDELAVRALLSGPLGRADPADFRDLRRTLRRLSAESGMPVRSLSAVRELLLGDADPAEVLGEDAFGRLSTPVLRIRALREATKASIEAGDSVETVLWNLWHASRKSFTLRSAVDHGGVAGRAADRSADAVLGLFDHAADFVEQMPRGSLRQFVSLMREQELPAPRRAGRRPVRRAVSLLSAHTSVAAEFEVVAVSGVQEGVWPAPRRRFGLFELDLLVDLIDRGETENLSDAEREAASMAAATTDERRLAVLAASRARRHVLFTAVENGEDLMASHYIAELERSGIPEWRTAEGGTGNLAAGHRMFTPSALVADLRANLQRDPGGPAAPAAARILATLGASGFAQAAPWRWYRGLPVSSSASPIPEPDNGTRAFLSPSAFAQLETCPLQWFIGGSIGSSTAMPLLKGTVVHAIAEAVQGDVPQDRIEGLVREFWPTLSPAGGWVLESEIEELLEMEEIVRAWLAAQGGYTSLGQELDFRMEIYPGGPTVEVGEEARKAVPVTVRGRIDRLDRDSSAAVRAVDFKSGAAGSVADGEANPQLALYQLAIRLGAVSTDIAPRAMANDAEAAHDPVSLTAGGVLVHLKPTGGRTPYRERTQAAMGPETQLSLMRRATAAGATSIGPVYLARTSSACATCAAAAMCPTQATGRQVGS